jgi:hypothetical protein
VVDGLPGSPDSGDFRSGSAQETQKVDYSLLVPSAPGRIDAWRLAGNAIVPQLHAEAIRAFMETQQAENAIMGKG